MKKLEMKLRIEELQKENLEDVKIMFEMMKAIVDNELRLQSVEQEIKDLDKMFTTILNSLMKNKK